MDFNEAPGRDLDGLERALREVEPAAATTWEHARLALGERAGAEGLVDVAFETHDSPLGLLLVGATARGVVRVGLPVQNPDALLEELARRISPRVLRAPRNTVTQARRELDQYFEGERHEFEVTLDWQLTGGFRRDVLRATARIPYGQTASYRDVAAEAGSPRAFRAAGSALATNPLPIVVPCHRVLRSGGGLGEYGGGPEMKARLLRLEGST